MLFNTKAMRILNKNIKKDKLETEKQTRNKFLILIICKFEVMKRKYKNGT